ncbi:hypothetical protein EDD21DRAFT_360360 [Dissophora ornata]|nr:hypothetical protein EDD21DRAFT_360360 [Dissophora ornata]
MAPIPFTAAKPLSIITGALFTAFSAPSSSPPTNGLNATVWGTEYTGSASFLNLTLLTSPSSSTPSSTTSSSVSTPTSTSSTSPSTPSSTPAFSTTNSSLVYYNTKNQTYTGCNNQTFSPTDNVALMNPLQFGNITSSNSTCGEWIQIQNRENTQQSTYAQIVGVCDDCEYGSVDLSIGALSELAPNVPFEDMTFDSSSNNTIADLLDPISPMPINSTTISPKNLLNIVWSLSDPPQATSDSTPGSSNVNTTRTSTATATTTANTTATATATTTATTTTTTTSTSTPTPTSVPSTPFTGRATWYSDTNGQCGHSYSQSDLIVAVNQAQMGTGTSLCGKKILLTEKGSNVQVVVTVVDMCPSQFCSSGDLDLSQAAFKKFAGLGVGELQLQWGFM